MPHAPSHSTYPLHPPAKSRPPASEQGRHPVFGGLFRQSRWGCRRFRIGLHRAVPVPGALASGPAFPARNGAALSARARRGAAADGAFPARGYTDRSRGRTALPCPGRGGGRDLGQSPRCRLQDDEEARHAGRGFGGDVLADPPRGATGSQRRPGTLARDLAAFNPELRRCARTRSSPLAGRAFPVAQPRSGPVAGDP